MSWLLAHLRDFRVWCLIGAFALAALTFLVPSLTIKKDIYHYFIVIDITQSQNAEDYVQDGKPIARLALTKHVVRKLIRELPCGSTVGIGLFAGIDFSDMASMSDGPPPPSRDAQVMAGLFTPIEICRNFSAVDKAVEQIDWRMAWTDGSSVAAALAIAIKWSAAAGPDVRTVFFTDGEEVPPRYHGEPPPFSGKKGAVKGMIVGVGGASPAAIPKFDVATGERIGYLKDRSALDESYLKTLEVQTGLTYRRLTSEKDLIAALLQPGFAHREAARLDVRWIFGSVALALVLIAILL